MTGEPLSAGERDTVQAGCGQLVLVDRLDAGRPLRPLLEALAHRGGGLRVLAGAVKVYATRYECGIGDPEEARRCARRLTRLAAIWPRLGRRLARQSWRRDARGPRPRLVGLWQPSAARVARR